MLISDIYSVRVDRWTLVPCVRLTVNVKERILTIQYGVTSQMIIMECGVGWGGGDIEGKMR